MSTSPVIYSFKAIERRPRIRELQSFSERFAESIRSNRALPTDTQVSDLPTTSHAGYGIARVTVPINALSNESQVPEVVDIYNSGSAELNLEVVRIAPSSTQSGFDYKDSGIEEASLRSQALGEIARTLFEAAKSDIALNELSTTTKRPRSINDALHEMPEHTFVLIRDGLLPKLENYLRAINAYDSTAIDRGGYISIDAGPFPFGRSTHPEELTTDYYDPKEAYHQIMQMIVSELLADHVGKSAAPSYA